MNEEIWTPSKNLLEKDKYFAKIWSVILESLESPGNQEDL